ncbi:C4-dicarboxylate transporter DcuC [Enterococcus faecalis]|nr:C4-dicarboxylate transporter DcuC [Enterococcus faecalis]MDA3739365.1 C4-dicarboxylate transporter DcuC [Enterococcus faecalis]
MDTKKRPIIIDTDPGIDDAVALAIALNHPNLEVRLITTVAGNVDVEKTTNNALKLVDFFGKKVPVAKGCNCPLLIQLEDSAEIHGETGMDGFEFPQPISTCLDIHAVEAMRKEILSSDVPKFYAILPILPLLLIVGVGIAGMFIKGITMDIFVLTFISFFIAVLVETLRLKSFKKVQDTAVEMFKGMGQGFSQVVMLVVGGSLFTSAIQTLGIIDSIMASVEASSSAGIVTTLIFSGATTLFGILSGGGLAMFYAVIELIPGIAEKAGIDGILISLPMQMIANLTRTISPVAAVVMIVASTVGVSPIRILKRTSVPTIIGIISVIVLSILLLPY